MPTSSSSEPTPQTTESQPQTVVVHLQEKQDNPEPPDDQRVQVIQNNGGLIIKVTRTSVFWQPATLIVVWLILFPLAIVLSIWAICLAAGGPDLTRHILPVEPPLSIVIAAAIVPWLALACAIFGAMKTVVFLADREQFRVQSRWVFFKTSRAWPVADIRDFSYDEYLERNRRTGVLWRGIYLLPKKGQADVVFQSARLPFEHMNYIASLLRHYYGR
jgi:hypothetical protein